MVKEHNTLEGHLFAAKKREGERERAMASTGIVGLQRELDLLFLPNTATTGPHRRLVLSSKVPSKGSFSCDASFPVRQLRRARERPRNMLAVFAAAASSADTELIRGDEAPAQTADHTASLKVDLLAMVAGLDRGLFASESDVEKVNCVAGQLETAGGPVRLVDGEDLQGRWRLIYSSGFASGSLGGRRPGPPVGRLPLTLGQVYQRIDVLASELDNIVDLRIGFPWPLPPLEATATLVHTFQLIGDNSIMITFEKISAKFGGTLSQLPPYELPQLPDLLRPSPSLRSGSFEITYLDKSMRISRGDRGELRIFVLA